MGVKRHLLFNIAIAFAVASCIVALSERSVLKRFELNCSDILFRLRPPLTYDSRIIIVEINDEDIARIGRWPWDRDWHATVVKALDDFGAKYVWFDVIFSESSGKDDDVFAQAIKESGNVYLPYALKRESISARDVLKPIKKLSSHIKGTGFINIYPDIDGVIRRIPLFTIDSKGIIQRHMALTISMDLLGLAIKKIDHNELTIVNSTQEISIPLVDNNKMLINWLGPWKNTFVHYSFLGVCSFLE